MLWENVTKHKQAFRISRAGAANITSVKWKYMSDSLKKKKKRAGRKARGGGMGET